MLAPPADLGRFLLDKFFVQPATPVMSPPNLSVHKPTGNCASRYNDCPLMPCRCPRRVLVQFEYLDVDGCEARGCHRDLTWFNRPTRRISLRGMPGHSGQQSAGFQPELRSLRYFCRLTLAKRHRQTQQAVRRLRGRGYLRSSRLIWLKSGQLSRKQLAKDYSGKPPGNLESEAWPNDHLRRSH